MKCDNRSKSWSATEEDNFVYLVGLGWQCVLRVSSARSGAKFRHVLFPIGLIKGGRKWVIVKVSFSLRQRQSSLQAC